MAELELIRRSEFVWELPREGAMRVPARVYATESMLPQIRSDNAMQQARNVACLPGIVTASLAMPDIHWGYGFPIGGVAAFDTSVGVISPGGVGYDINCGVRLMTSNLVRQDVAPSIRPLLSSIFHAVPSGVGSRGVVDLSKRETGRVVREGARWAVARGYGNEDDLERVEENGCMSGADPRTVSKRAAERGRSQLGTLGSGNHFIEIAYVAEIYDKEAAEVLGLFPDQVTLTVHCGSRGYGHQVCDDYLAGMDEVSRRYRIDVPDRQLACVPVASREGKAYLGAMACAVNYAFANRQVIAELARRAFYEAFRRRSEGVRLRTVYEVAHNIARIETHRVGGRWCELCVHRKGATRAFAGARAEVPEAYRTIGQPVLIPGDMGRYSYVLVGTEKAMAETFGSACHGAGRLMSRHAATRAARERDIGHELAGRGIVVMAKSRRTLDEEMPEAYKDVADVVDACSGAGLTRKVAQLRPLGVVKG